MKIFCIGRFKAVISAIFQTTIAGTGDEVGYDANKKFKGRKRHIAIDTQGNVMTAGITLAFCLRKREHGSCKTK